MPGPDVWSFLKGYVIIRVTGTGLESWANRAVRSGIPLWNVSRPLPDTLVVRVRRADVARLRSLRDPRVRYRILGRFGLSAPLTTLRRRWGLFLGAAAFLLFFYLATSLVWFIEIEAPPGIDKQAVRAAAARAGVYRGQRLDRVNAGGVERRLLLELPQVAWVNLELRGTRALIQVAERPGWGETEAPYGHMVADRDGVVVQVVPLRGQPQVAEGEAVSQGQVLISGLLAPESDEYGDQVEQVRMPYQRAEGRVYARVWYEEYGEAPLEEEERQPTGRRERFHVVQWGDRRWMIPPRPSRFQHFVEEGERRREWPLLGTFPVRWETGWRYEVTVTRRRRSVEEAVAVAEEQARRLIDARRKPDGQLVREQVDLLSRGEGDGRVRVRVLVETRENIAVFEPVGAPAPPGEGAAEGPARGGALAGEEDPYP